MPRGVWVAGHPGALGRRTVTSLREGANPWPALFAAQGGENATNIHFNDTQQAEASAETHFDVITDYAHKETTA